MLYLLLVDVIEVFFRLRVNKDTYLICSHVCMYKRLVYYSISLRYFVYLFFKYDCMYVCAPTYIATLFDNDVILSFETSRRYVKIYVCFGKFVLALKRAF